MNWEYLKKNYIAVLACLMCITSGSDFVRGDDTFERLGLVNEWFTNLEAGGRSEIVNMQLQVNEDIATTYFLVEYGKNVERISERDLDAFGNRRGIEGPTGARQYAATRQEILTKELAAQKRTDIKVTVRQITLPKTTIFTSTSSGVVSAIDADTGRHLWSNRVGNRSYFTTGVGASKRFVAMTNGSSVYCLSADEGRLLWSKKCRRAPSAAPAVGEHSVFVPMVDGRLEVFSLEDRGQFPRTFMSFGTSISKPLLTNSTVSWATDSGYYAVAPFLANSISFRLNSGDKMAAGGAAGDGVIYVTTTSGSIFALNEKRGGIEWEYLTGDRITQAPFVKDDAVFVISDENRLYKIDSITGRPASGWAKPLKGYSKFVGASLERIYLLDSVGQLTALDPGNGTRLGTVSGVNVNRIIPNRVTDRLYVSTSNGLIHCYRETDNTFPMFRADELEMMGDKKVKAANKDDDSGDPFAADEDPFAADEDPFAADDDPFASDKDSDDGDPFGNDSDDDDDPFGNDGDSDDDDDPFGGGSDDDDPFGG